jgi:dihydroneopterin aldolase
MRDCITITGVRGFGFHGVFEFEKRDGQEFIADVILFTDLQKASKSDALEDTIDYSRVTTLVKAEIEGPAVDLIEHLAGRIADSIKSQFSVIEKVAVTIHKPQAPVNENVADISVTITR